MFKSDNKFKHAFMAIASTAILFSQSENTLAAENNPVPDAAADSVTAPEEARSSQSSQNSSAGNAESPEMDTKETSYTVLETKTPEIAIIPEADETEKVMGKDVLAEETGTTEVAVPDESNVLNVLIETTEPIEPADAVGSGKSAWNTDPTGSIEPTTVPGVTSEIVEIITILDETEVITELPENPIVDLTATEPETKVKNSVSESAETDITDAAEVTATNVENTAENEEDIKDAEIKTEAEPAESTASTEMTAAETQPETADTPAAETLESEAVTLFAGTARTVTAERNNAIPTYDEAREAMLALKDQKGFTEGTTWTNFEPYGSKGDKGNDYKWKGGPVKGADRGVGCAAFVFILSDEAFGSLPSRTIDQGDFQYEDIKPGDILRINSSHFVIVTQVSPGGVIVAEANYNKSVHWGRTLSKDEVMASDFIVTRYPEGYVSPDSENADEVVSQGTEGNLGWTLTRAGTLTISGTGSMPDYSPNDNKMPSWNAPANNINAIIIDKGVTNIGDYAFYGSQALTVYLPDSVSAIGNSAFQNSNLVNVTLPGSVTEVGDGAFQNCKNLVSASISEGLRTIGDNAFRACTSLQYIDFPSTIESIGSGAFMSCLKMTRIRFKPGTVDVTFEGNGTFAECQYLMDVTLPQGLTKICDSMFASCTLLSRIYIPASVTDIGMNPFTATRIQYNGDIIYGGSEDTWKRIGGQLILNTLPNANYYYEAEFEDPFAEDPNDPGDINLDQGSTPENPGHTHNWANDWNHDNTWHWHECGESDCPISNNAGKDGYAEHSYGEWVVDTEATADRDGSRHRSCVCGYSETERIPATGNTGTGGSPEDSGKPNNPENPGGTKDPENPDGSGNTDKPNGQPGNSGHPTGSGGSNISTKPAGSASSTGTGTSHIVYVPPADVTIGSQAGQTAGAVLPPQNSVTSAGQPDTPVLLTDTRTETRGSQPVKTADTKRNHSDQTKDKSGKTTSSKVRQNPDRTGQKKTASANGQDSGQDSSDPIPQTTLNRQPNDTSEDDMVKVIVPAVCIGAGGLGALYITLRKRR